jgi:hypothetical protein
MKLKAVMAVFKVAKGKQMPSPISLFKLSDYQAVKLSV